MKLFTRYSRINLLANIALFLVASVAFYVSIRYVLIHQIDEDLKIEEDEITAFAREHNRLPERFSVADQVISFTAVRQKPLRQLTTVPMQDNDENNLESYRCLTFGLTVAGQPYQANVSKSLEGTDSLLRSILLVTTSTILLILLVNAILNRVVLKKLWQPFYESLQAVKSFRPSKNQPPFFPSTPIDEFNTLNETLEKVTQSSRVEYLSLKTFSENAAHEIQTPIAIIRSKLDLLIQDEQITQGQSEMLQSAYNAVEKLSRLNRSLLLLAKIENNQFEEVTRLDFKTRVSEKLQEFQELWTAKSITLKADLQPVEINMNGELADILLNNLLSNAIHHNHTGGSILLNLTKNELTIRNTGAASELDNQQLFRRFYKHSTSSSLNGLGLSIVKQICDASGFEIQYRYQDALHSFFVRFC